jgi:hypothetical protein
MTHFIRQQYFDVDLKGSESDGFALQHHLSDLYYAQLLPAIEKALDQCSTSGQHFVIDRLDIDAGIIELERIDQDLASIVANALAHDIREKSAIRQADIGEQTGSYMMDSEENLWEVFVHFISKGSLPWSFRLPTGKSLEEVISELLMNDGIINSNRILADRIKVKLNSPNAAKRLAIQFSEHFITLLRQKIYPIQVDSFDQFRQGNLWEVFIHFLLNGNLPGLYKLPPETSLEYALTDLLNEADNKVINPIPVAKIAEVFKSPFAAHRLAFQFSEQFFLKLLERISPDILVELKSILRVSENRSFAPDQARLVRKFVLEKTISQIFSGKSISKVEIAKQVIDDLQISADLHLLVSKVFEQVWPEIKMPANELSDTIERLIPLGKNLETNRLQSELINTDSQLPGIKITENKVPSSKVPAIEKLLPNDSEDGIYINNAGLVLLHPFLPRFFETLGISKEEEILQPERALSLLYYLTTGQTKIPEYELVLPKVLCEFPLLIPVPADFKITENEISEASALLEAVIKHWEVLRNTTPDGLRGTFLLRPGKLSQKEDGDWLLQVESHTFDVLLEHLPWGISMIKLPWMKNMLWVEWSF